MPTEEGEPCTECLHCQGTLVAAIANDNMRAFLARAFIHAAVATAGALMEGGPNGRHMEEQTEYLMALMYACKTIHPESVSDALALLATQGVIIEESEL